MTNKNKNRRKESYDTIEEAVVAIFVKQKDRKRMLSVIFLLAIVGAVIIATGTHFLLKQQAVIEQNKDIDWKNRHAIANQLRLAKKEREKKESFSMGEYNGDGEVVKMFFVGDLMLDRYNRSLMQRHGEKWLTKEVNHLFLENDINVANLEGPVTDEESVSIGTKEGAADNYIFTFNPDSTKSFLLYNKINLLNIGNNHILNFGEDGLAYTKGFLLSNKFDSFGDIKGEGGMYAKKEVGDIKISFVSYNQFGGNGLSEVLESVEELEDSSDFTIIYAHWGNEYDLIENESQKNKAHAFIDAGADLIIGSHPHVVQPVEDYKGKKIFYSLGNFVFDQYFSSDTMTGLGVKVLVSKEKDLGFELIPLEISKNGQLKPATTQVKEALFKRIITDRSSQ